jgi:hypothetical protein
LARQYSDGAAVATAVSSQGPHPPAQIMRACVSIVILLIGLFSYLFLFQFFADAFVFGFHSVLIFACSYVFVQLCFFILDLQICFFRFILIPFFRFVSSYLFLHVHLFLFVCLIVFFYIVCFV